MQIIANIRKWKTILAVNENKYEVIISCQF